MPAARLTAFRCITFHEPAPRANQHAVGSQLTRGATSGKHNALAGDGGESWRTQKPIGSSPSIQSRPNCDGSGGAAETASGGGDTMGGSDNETPVAQPRR